MHSTHSFCIVARFPLGFFSTGGNSDGIVSSIPCKPVKITANHNIHITVTISTIAALLVHKMCGDRTCEVIRNGEDYDRSIVVFSSPGTLSSRDAFLERSREYCRCAFRLSGDMTASDVEEFV